MINKQLIITTILNLVLLNSYTVFANINGWSIVNQDHQILAFGGKHVGGGTATTAKDGSKNTGNYILNEFSITLKHDDDYEHTELFYFEDSDKKSFIYKNDRYWID